MLRLRCVWCWRWARSLSLGRPVCDGCRASERVALGLIAAWGLLMAWIAMGMR